MNNQIKAIETKYKGYRFRSRLEARYAVAFDNILGKSLDNGYDVEFTLYLGSIAVNASRAARFEHGETP